MSCADIWAMASICWSCAVLALLTQTVSQTRCGKAEPMGIAEPKPDEAMADAPKLRKAKGGRKKKQSSGAATAAQDTAGKSEAADAEAMQQ